MHPTFKEYARKYGQLLHGEKIRINKKIIFKEQIGGSNITQPIRFRNTHLASDFANCDGIVLRRREDGGTKRVHGEDATCVERQRVSDRSAAQ
jgi:hypothetical protein